ncbi:glycoside hydrolase family 43 protein [Tessaracoccus sp. MC1627]|uniref:glycoside hydrolase family 43 protein n=1 Tax=Tessaracoccus sp. MC1627 TaxID=2760312 RepID=UPI0016030816|nr:glycoside hydrolase family 43 protein [Tessaracoccus sp. MC1627]MBB1511109.1 glycoside hydrolase family 43 protein [Tessaracoccus sp. MC1627]
MSTPPNPPHTPDVAGYLLVHFVEDPHGHGERVYFSLSNGPDPTRWTRANAGHPVLESSLGTTGARDPFIVHGDGEYYIIATDLRVYGGDNQGWDEWKRTGSRSIIVWKSPNLIDWSTPWTLDIAPPEAGMAWAPEAIYDQHTGRYLLFWASTLFNTTDPHHRGTTYSRILAAWTTDFTTITTPEPMIDYGVDIIDTTMFLHDGRVHRISKEDSGVPHSRRLFHETGTGYFSHDFDTLAQRIADDTYHQVEGPLVFFDHHAGRWVLLVDQFDRRPQGYVALVSTDPQSGWTSAAREFVIPPNTKHGSVLPLTHLQWVSITQRFAAPSTAPQGTPPPR